MFKLKRHIALLLVFAFCFGTIWQTAIIIHFYANQAEIEAEFCVNLDRPELQCHGQCHLTEQLTQATPAQTEYNQTENLKTNILLLFAFVQSSTHIEYEFKEPFIFSVLGTAEIRDYNPIVFHPPKTLLT